MARRFVHERIGQELLSTRPPSRPSRVALGRLAAGTAGAYNLAWSSRPAAGASRLASGDLAKARETYKTITALTVGRLGYGATWARSFYHLGLIAEKQGDKARAREQFRRFLEIWKDADQGIPEVADAKKRLAQ